MPRPAAIMLGLMLAALSIGFNAVRYPAIWDMVQPPLGRASFAQPAAAPQSIRPEAMQSPAKEVEPIHVRPMPEVGKQVTVEKPVVTETKSVEGSSLRALVPVIAVGMSGVPAIQATGGASIRRLPPVTAGAASVLNDVSPDGRIPIYPTTGIE